MSDRHQDFELLQRFTRQGEQSAFADLVRRHLDLVFGTALRKVEDLGAAQEVAQNVFTALARKAWRFAPDDSLPAWLHKAALLESKSWLRGELGRRRREWTAAELGTTMNTPEEQPVFRPLLPLLDEALLSLREKDRTALLLRYYESQSLRDVGAAFGVSEDTAQKRVQSALEKLAGFFKEHGFKTASVAAAAAALQSTATSASGTMVSTVVSAVLKAAPPALTGLGALLARMASLSRVRTAAVCVALAAVPVAWQLNQRYGSANETRWIHAQLLAAQNELAVVQAEIARLRGTSGRLERFMAQSNEAAALAAESAQAFEAWKRRIRGLVTATDYRWDDDSPFARIPKAVLPKLSELSGAEPFSPPGVVLPYARELMGLTASEREAVEEALRQSFAEVESKLDAGIHETNVTSPGRIPDTALAARVFIVPALLDEEAKQPGDKMLAEVRSIVGEDRWPLVEARLLEERGGHRYSGGLRSILSQSQQDLAVWVETDDKGTPTMGYGFNGGVATMGKRPLFMFLPEGSPSRIEGAEDFGRGFLSKTMRQRAATWLQEQAIARVGKNEKP
jgi:RNA polymerase sigma factor (sigma-70 family)